MTRRGKLAAILCFFATAFLASTTISAPAHADVLSSNCNTIADDGQPGAQPEVCLAVTWHRLGGGPGINVDRIQTSINTSGPWSGPVAVDCRSVLVYRNDGDADLKWSKTGDACDVQKYPGNHEYAPDVEMPLAQCAWVQWNGNANISGAPDKDFSISVKFCR